MYEKTIERLERAAQILRESTSAATADGWSVHYVGPGEENHPEWMIDNAAGRSKDYDVPEVAMVHREHDAAYIALMDPETGALIAPWLEGVASDLKQNNWVMKTFTKYLDTDIRNRSDLMQAEAIAMRIIANAEARA